MSTASPGLNAYSKFTRGEKCIFTHLIITFVAINAIVVFYFVHVCLVRHSGSEFYRITRRDRVGQETQEHSDSFGVRGAYGCAGALYVGGAGGAAERAACGAALVAARWSLAPARCAAARALPALEHLLPYWTLRYESHARGASGVKRGVVHPQYDDDSLACNVALLEHTDAIAAPCCALPTKMIEDEHLQNDAKDVVLVGWQVQGGRGAAGVRALTPAQCRQFSAAVVDTLRAGELCVAPLTPLAGQHLQGAALFVNARMAAIVSWGDNKGRSFPIIVLDLAPYKVWLQTTMSL